MQIKYKNSYYHIVDSVILYYICDVYMFNLIFKVMVTQKVICFKCDTDSLDQLDSLCSILCINRNKLLNRCVAFGVKMMFNEIDIVKRQHRPLSTLKSIYFISADL